jgi:hypothetical protein
MMVIPVVCFGAAIFFLLGSRPLPEDLRRFQSVDESTGDKAVPQSA